MGSLLLAPLLLHHLTSPLLRFPTFFLLPPSHFFVPREVPRFPQRGALEPLERCPGTSGEVPWGLWRGALEPLGDSPGASKKKLWSLSGGAREPLGGSLGPLREFFYPQRSQGPPQRLPGTPREAPKFFLEAPGHLSRGSRAPLCGNLGTSRGTTKWDGGSRVNDGYKG